MKTKKDILCYICNGEHLVPMPGDRWALCPKCGGTGFITVQQMIQKKKDIPFKLIVDIFNKEKGK